MSVLSAKLSGPSTIDLRRGAARRLFPWVLALAALALSSCQIAQPTLHTVRYDNPHRPILIATAGRAQAHQLIAFFTETNPRADLEGLREIALAYVAEAAAEGINSDVAFCQMAIETNYLRFGGNVRASQNNFCGLGVTGDGERGVSFPSVQIGVRAHIQHLKAYANAQPLRKRCVDPRFALVRRGRAPFVEDLAGTWATDPQYAQKLKRHLAALEKHL